MNFEEWHSTELNEGNQNIFIRADNKIPKEYAKKSWDACKKEVLKILDKNLTKKPENLDWNDVVNVINELKNL